MTATIIEGETLESLDFEFEPPCEVKGCTPEPANFLTVFACCGHEMLFCEECLNAALQWSNAGGAWYCDVCLTRGIRGNPFALIKRIDE